MSKDKLEDIFEKQEALDDMVAYKYGHIYPNHVDRSQTDDETYWDVTKAWVRQMLFCIIAESAEVLDAIQYKHWKNYSEPVVEEDLKEEVLDIFFFSLSLLIKVGYTPDEIHAAYMKKHEENIKRQNGESKQKDYSQ